MKIFNMHKLIAANEFAKIRNYNRQLADEVYDFPKDSVFPIVQTIIHEHAQGKRVEPHVRCFFLIDGQTAVVDCDAELFGSLEEAKS